jgi:hypothetical protein
MTPTYACKHGGIRYGYYVCTNAFQRGRKACPSGSLSHSAIEGWVVEQTHKLAAAEQDGSFSPWELLGRDAQASLLRAWVARVDYDGAAGKAAITFHAPELRGGSVQPTEKAHDGASDRGVEGRFQAVPTRP